MGALGGTRAFHSLFFQWCKTKNEIHKHKGAVGASFNGMEAEDTKQLDCAGRWLLFFNP